VPNLLSAITPTIGSQLSSQTKQKAKTTTMVASFSINLADAAKLHLSFLQDAHREGITLSPVTKKSLERYVNIWLPVVVSFSFGIVTHV
jgi:hypothetical protein